MELLEKHKRVRSSSKESGQQESKSKSKKQVKNNNNTPRAVSHRDKNMAQSRSKGVIVSNKVVSMDFKIPSSPVNFSASRILIPTDDLEL